jgi:two-component system phosphate regulon sensor histidine kinase PhoR
MNTYSIPVFVDNEGNNKYQLLVSFPQKEKFLVLRIAWNYIIVNNFYVNIVLLMPSALNQLIQQRQISEIKTDFINNMTHEFKTPIATINLL